MLTPAVVKPASMSIVSGNGQTATVGTDSGERRWCSKITDSTGAGVPGALVSFTVSPEGAATLQPSPALTLERRHGDRLTVTLGSTPGRITITAVSYAVSERDLLDHGDCFQLAGYFNGRGHQRRA